MYLELKKAKDKGFGSTTEKKKNPVDCFTTNCLFIVKL